MTTADTAARQHGHREELARLGREVSERDILPQIEADRHGD